MKKKFTLIAVILASVLTVLIGYNIYTLRTRNVIESLIAQKRMINILIAGSNTYNNNHHRFCSILSINPENNHVGFTFLPPSLKLDISGGGSDYQKLEDIDISDFSELSTALEKEIKLSVPFYIELYAVDVARLVDLFGGVDIFVLNQLHNTKTEKFGLHYYDGKKIVEYINLSDNNSIFQKYDRIQDIILSLYYNREQYNRYVNSDFISEAGKSIKTNIMPQEFLSLLRQISGDSVIMTTILPGEFDDKHFYTVDTISYKIYEKEFLSRLFHEKDGLASIKVKILNGTDVPGMARRMRNLLIREGLTVVEFGNSPYPILPHSVLINQRGNISNVMKVAKISGIKKIYHVIDNTQLHDVLIIIGKDFEK